MTDWVYRWTFSLNPRRS